jgi:hypothetical protein
MEKHSDFISFVLNSMYRLLADVLRKVALIFLEVKVQKTKRARLNKRHHCWFCLSSRAHERGTTRYSVGEYLIKNDGCCQPPSDCGCGATFAILRLIL